MSGETSLKTSNGTEICTLVASMSRAIPTGPPKASLLRKEDLNLLHLEHPTMKLQL